MFCSPRCAEGSARDSVGENRDAAGIIEDDAAWAEAVRWGRLSKGDKLAELASMKPSSYPSFRRRFYIEPPEVSSMSMVSEDRAVVDEKRGACHRTFDCPGFANTNTARAQEEVQQVRRKMDGIKVRGRAVPAPIQSWNQAGLSQRVQDALRKAGYPSPMPIQAQALPAVMSGRDCIGIAKTGSGKTLAYVLPLLRHVKDQPPLQDGDGPVGLVIAPTRELVVQIGKECRRFARVVGLSCVAVYGGSGVGSQIADLKRGAEVVVCTPGRMIDVLVTGNGKITNLWRVTMLVVDEADRLFDLGFEPQVMRIIDQIRPDRQTVLFSATFPKQVEVLARQLLVDPVEILVGGRSVVNSSIRQVVEVREPEDRLIRLLEILGEWYDRGKVLVFVQKQESCDVLFRELLQLGYPCMSLHGGKDQADRGSTIADFKAGVCNVLIATSLAARGLDIPDLVLVVNYDVPNHLEDYVHRVGRTGRAGNEGTAITFISCEEAQYAPDLVRALKDSGAPVPEDLLLLADSFVKLVKAGKAAKHGSGYGGSGFKFDDKEDDQKKAERVAVLKEYGVEMGEVGDGLPSTSQAHVCSSCRRGRLGVAGEHIELMVADADKAADRGESEDDEGIATPKEVAASAAGIASVSGASAGELRSRRSRFDCTAGPPKAGVVTGAPQQEEEVPPAMESDGKQAGWRPNEPLRPKPRGPTTAEATRAAAQVRACWLYVGITKPQLAQDLVVCNGHVPLSQAAAVAAALSGGHLLSSKLAATRVAEQYSQTLESARDRVIADKEGRDIKGEKRPLQTEWSEFADELEINDFVQHARYASRNICLSCICPHGHHVWYAMAGTSSQVSCHTP